VHGHDPVVVVDVVAVQQSLTAQQLLHAALLVALARVLLLG
jgi:hypothetical protein